MDKKKKKTEYADDPGISFTNMNVPGMPYNKHAKKLEDVQKPQKQKFTGKEKRQLIGASFVRLLPILLVVVGAFSIAALLMWGWLSCGS